MRPFKIILSEFGDEKFINVPEGEKVELIYPKVDGGESSISIILSNDVGSRFFGIVPDIALSKDNVEEYYQSLYKNGNILYNPYDFSTCGELLSNCLVPLKEFGTGILNDKSNTYDTVLGQFEMYYDKEGSAHVLNDGVHALSVASTSEGYTKELLAVDSNVKTFKTR